MNSRRRRSLKFCLGFLLGCIVLSAAQGCGGPPPIIRQTGESIEGYDEMRERIRKDPVAFLEESYAAARKLDGFSTGFMRQERLGVLGQLRPVENMIADYRTDPLSVRFTWTDPDSEYLQAVYVQGKHGDKVRLLPRYGMFGLPAKAENYPPHWAVLFGKSKFPIMDFGPRRLLQKTLERIKAAKAFGGVKITLKDATEMGDTKEPCFHLELRYPKDDAFKPKLQDLYIHTETRLPVATFLWLPDGGELERTGATLDAMYQYSGMNPAAEITDETFVIDADKKPKKG